MIYLNIRHSPNVEEYLRSKMVAYNKFLIYEGEVQKNLSYINLKNNDKGKAKKKGKQMFLVPYTGP